MYIKFNKSYLIVGLYCRFKKAPMPGVVAQVLVSANHSVKKDDILMTLEAMKMEYTIRAPKDGLIVDSYFQVGDQVKAGDELVEFVGAAVVFEEFLAIEPVFGVAVLDDDADRWVYAEKVTVER